MPDPTGLDTTSWQNRLPGHPQGPVSPSWQSPEGLYQYIIQNVPGISAQAAAWMHGRILGGQGVTNDTLGAQLGGLSVPQLAAINQLQPFSMGATNVQPHVPGDPLPPPQYPPTSPLPPGSGQNVVQHPPGVPVYPPITHTNVPHPIGHGVVGEEADPAAGWYNSSLNGVPIHVDPSSQPASHVVVSGNHPNDVGYGPGAALAEHMLGVGDPSAGINYAVDHPPASPVKYLRRWRGGFGY